MVSIIGLLLLTIFMLGLFVQACKRNFMVLGVAGGVQPQFNYDALLSTTIANYRKQLADNLSKSFLLMYWLTTKGRKLYEDGGESIIVPLMYGKNQTVRSYDGYEVLDTTPQEGITAAKFPWKQVAGSISISRKEERQNSGEQRIVKLLDSKVKQAEISMRDELNRMLHADGTGNNSKDLFGLALLVEVGGSWGTAGGIDRSDALNAWWRNQYIGSVGAFATLGPPAMRTLYNNCSRGNEHPDIIIMAQAAFEAYETSLVINQRFTDSRVADGSFEMLKFKGAVCGYDEQADAATILMLNSAYLGFTCDTQTDLITTEFVRPENQDAKVAQILLMANLVASNCARQGRMDGITFP
jgi:hypothetical protein